MESKVEEKIVRKRAEIEEHILVVMKDLILKNILNTSFYWR